MQNSLNQANSMENEEIVETAENMENAESPATAENMENTENAESVVNTQATVEKKGKKPLLWAIIGGVALLAIAAVVLILCLGGGKNTETTPTTAPVAGAAGTYTVTVQNVAGQPMSGITVYVYNDAALANMVSYGNTDENGLVSLDLPAGEHYIVLSAVPKGYATEAYYTFSGNAAQIVLTSSLITDEDISTATLGVGDIMYDFTVTKPDGKTVTLSDVLKEKKVAIINFWYTTCTYCVQEFPLMQAAYEQYQDKVGIIAVDPMDGSQAVAAFQAEAKLTFDMASCPASWANVFGVQGYPTTVVVDRYGRICMVESGALLTERLWTSLFDHFTADNYEQKLLQSAHELLTKVKPDAPMPSNEELSAALNVGDLKVSYRADEDEYAWPFVVTTKGDKNCLKAPNKELDDSYAILYIDVELKAGQALGFDYLKSSEANNDVLHVIVNDEPIYSISGTNNPEKWETCYPVVADKDGTYEIALCYIKDSSNSAGDDTVYLTNLRLVNISDIDVPTYIPRQAAVPAGGLNYTYAELVYNSADGYYHVGSENGPLLLIDLMSPTAFNKEQSIWDMCYAGMIKDGDNDFTKVMTQYASYASNSNLVGVCSVTQELYDILLIVDKVCGFYDDDNMEWLKACKYFEAYGTNGVQLEDPIKGLAPFSAYTAILGKDIETNRFSYNRIIIPRGLYAKFIPEVTGAYRITSRTDSKNGVEGWIFDENRNILLTYEHVERMWGDDEELSMVFYMEAGKAYFIDIAFWDPYEVGTIYYDIEFLGEEYDYFRLCSPGYFTSDTDATGSAMYDIVAGGIDVVLGEDGYYYHKKADGTLGSRIYADFTGLTPIFKEPIATVGDIKGLIDKGAFIFGQTEYDHFVLSALAQNNGDKEKTKAYLKQEWGTDYEELYKEYKVDDVFAGIYHGKGEDYSDEISAYLDKIITEGNEELLGCVAVDAELAVLLQMLMDKFTFEGVTNSWLKMCYYYDYMGQ